MNNENETKSEKTRRLIIETSAPIFNKNGYRGTSLSQLTEATGLSKGALYGNFKNKDEIALEALKFNYRIISDAIAKKVRTEKSAKDKLKAFANFYDENYFFISGTGGCPVLNSAVDFDDGDPVFKSVVKSFVEEWRGSITGIIKKGIKKGEIKNETRAESFSSAFISLIEGGIMMSKITDNRDHLKSSVACIIDMIETKL